MPRPRSTEQGFTLIELLVYVSFFVVVLVIVGGILINSLTVEKTVRGSAGTANLGQLLSQSIGQSVRNATAITTSSSSESTGVAGSELLVLETLTAGGTATVQCHAWLYVPLHGGQLFSARAPARIPIPAVDYLAAVPADQPISAPTGWSSFGEGVNPAGSTPVFSVNTHGVSYAFDLTRENGSTETVSGASSSHQTLKATSPLCF
ncbi:MAG: hypothetical protein R6W83_05475 [Cryobacterium sp.]